MRPSVSTINILLLASAMVWIPAAPLTAGETVRSSITVRVYETAGLSSALEQRALREAEALLRAARVYVRWQDCADANSFPSCSVPTEPAELLLVVQKGGNCLPMSPSLGKAVVVLPAGGVLATVYFTRVACLAKKTNTDVAVLLGRVIAHELGHLMMGRATHSHRGLMRPTWTLDEVRRNRAADWAFTAGDAAQMRHGGALAGSCAQPE